MLTEILKTVRVMQLSKECKLLCENDTASDE